MLKMARKNIRISGEKAIYTEDAAIKDMTRDVACF